MGPAGRCCGKPAHGTGAEHAGGSVLHWSPADPAAGLGIGAADRRDLSGRFRPAEAITPDAQANRTRLTACRRNAKGACHSTPP